MSDVEVYMRNELLGKDLQRYATTRFRGSTLFPNLFQEVSRGKGRVENNYQVIYKLPAHISHNDIAENAIIGPGLYIGHPYCITIGGSAVIGSNCNIHKGVTIGRENRGEREGIPTIGNDVWIGINAVIVGKIVIGDDVLIAPNSFVNSDIPSHSIVFGNPCIVQHKDKATEGYISRRVENIGCNQRTKKHEH